MILLANPSATDIYLSSGTTHILEPRRPAIVINSNFDLPMRRIVKEGTSMNGFILRDCKVIAKSIFAQNTRCGGNMCDR